MVFTLRTTAAACLSAALLLSAPVMSAGLGDLQAKVDKIAAQKGVPAPDVKAELTGTAVKVPEAPKTAKPAPITKIVAIDTETLRAIESGDGRIMYVLDNGRFAFVGKMIDVWERKELSTIDEIENAVNHIRLDKMGFSLERVNHFSVGEGSKHITLFVDPQCGWCHKLMLEIAGKPELNKTYTFDFVVVPVLGPKSEQLAKHLYCVKDSDDAAKFRAMMGGSAAIEALPAESDCDTTVYDQTRVIAGAIGVQSVPMVIADDGRFEKGKPRDLIAFLENRPQSDVTAGPGGATPAAKPSAGETVDLEKLGFELGRTNHIAVGAGTRHVTIFVDPLCTWCHKLMDEINAKPELQKTYTFDFVVIPILGQNSQTLSKKLFCAKDQNDAKRYQALSGGSEAVNALAQASVCDDAAFNAAIAEAKKSTVQAVPMLVADDGRVSRGKPRDLEAFLENRAQPVPTAAPKPDAGAETVNLGALGFDLAKTNHMAVGKGERHITIFVDPLCNWCHKLMDEVNAEPALQNEFTFDFVVIPILGARSQALSKKLFCAADADDPTRYKALSTDAEAINALKSSASCSDAAFAAAIVEARKSTVQAVPMLVADDGRVSRGKPRDLKAFLKPAAK